MYNFKKQIKKIEQLNTLKADLEKELSELKLRVQGMSSQVSEYEKEINEIKAEIGGELLSDGCLEHKQDGLAYKLRKLPRRLDVLCKPEELPEEYQRIKVEADKKKIKAEYKDGLSANYCKLSDVEYKLEIIHE